jgi:hypothetical protein
LLTKLKIIAKVRVQNNPQQAIMTMFCLPPTFLLLLALFATTFTNYVEAREMTSYKTKGVGAQANVDLGGDDCFYENLYIDASTSATKVKASGEKPSTTFSKVTFASYGLNNWCTGEESYGYAEVYPSNFTGNKDGAKASATISSLITCSYKEVGGYTCEEIPFEMTIKATWTATGSSFKDRYTYSYGGTSYSTTHTYSGTSREITTVALEVTKDGQTLGVDLSSVDAYLFTSMTGVVTRYDYY